MTTESSSVQESMRSSFLFALNQKLKMMRISLFTIMLFVCAGSMAQTTLISKGDIRLAIEVYDYENERLLDISKICDGFDDEGLPIDMVMPYRSQIKLWLPDVDSLNSSDYRYADDGGRARKLTNFNQTWQGKKVAYFGNKSYTGGSVDGIEIVKLEKIIAITSSNPSVSLAWKVDYGPIELQAFIQNDEVDERQQYSDSIMYNLFSSDKVVKNYDYWIEKGFSTRLDDEGLPENPIIPIGAGTLSFSTNAPKVEIYKDGEKVEFSRLEERFNDYIAYFYTPKESGSYLIRMTDPRKTYGQTSKTYSFTVPFSFWKEGGLWMVGIIAALVIGFVSYRIYATRQLKQSNMLKQLSDAELKAIRSQLNPHFLFNSLSAIQNLINQSKNELANDYIVKLSKLLRRVLVQSDKSLHSLQEELELAELYLDLEKLRIPFEYHIKVDDELDKNTLIPSMILQPYLENAVFHGVSKSKANQIALEVKKEGMQLTCSIRDNANHDGNFFTEGKGMSMGRDRIDILRKQVGDEIKADIRTAKNADGFVVEINLPLNL